MALATLAFLTLQTKDPSLFHLCQEMWIFQMKIALSSFTLYSTWHSKWVTVCYYFVTPRIMRSLVTLPDMFCRILSIWASYWLSFLCTWHGAYFDQYFNLNPLVWPYTRMDPTF